jgi:hypothetical protein
LMRKMSGNEFRLQRSLKPLGCYNRFPNGLPREPASFHYMASENRTRTVEP